MNARRCVPISSNNHYNVWSHLSTRWINRGYQTFMKTAQISIGSQTSCRILSEGGISLLLTLSARVAWIWYKKCIGCSWDSTPSDGVRVWLTQSLEHAVDHKDRLFLLTGRIHSRDLSPMLWTTSSDNSSIQTYGWWSTVSSQFLIWVIVNYSKVSKLYLPAIDQSYCQGRYLSNKATIQWDKCAYMSCHVEQSW